MQNPILLSSSNHHHRHHIAPSYRPTPLISPPPPPHFSHLSLTSSPHSIITPHRRRSISIPPRNLLPTNLLQRIRPPLHLLRIQLLSQFPRRFRCCFRARLSLISLCSPHPHPCLPTLPISPNSHTTPHHTNKSEKEGEFIFIPQQHQQHPSSDPHLPLPPARPHPVVAAAHQRS
jgi:hypothetical protein